MSGEKLFATSLFLVTLLLAWANGVSSDVPPQDEIIKKSELRTEKIIAQDINDILPVSSLVKPILYSDITFIENLTIPEAKSTFINIMLPAILIAKEELRFEQSQVKKLIDKKELSSADSALLAPLFQHFRTDDINELHRRMSVHPNSIILAQAAVESGWGKSRFFKEANNVFGVWSMSSRDDRIAAKFTRNGKKIFLKKYPDISASIMDYFYTIGKVGAYQKFRKERLKTQQVQDLLPYLISYSERGQDYVEQLAQMIRVNHFEQYDSYKIDPKYFN